MEAPVATTTVDREVMTTEFAEADDAPNAMNDTRENPNNRAMGYIGERIEGYRGHAAIATSILRRADALSDELTKKAKPFQQVAMVHTSSHELKFGRKVPFDCV